MRKLTGGARVAAAAGGRRARGRAGPARGPRARAGKTRRGLAGRLGWLAGAGRAGRAYEAFFFPFSFSVLFSFFFI